MWGLPQLSIQSFLITSFLGCITIVLYRNFIAPYRRLSQLGLKISMPTPLMGNNLDYGSTNQHIAQIKRQEMYGKIWGTLFFHIPTIWIGDPDILKSITVKEFSNFTNRFALNQPRPPFDKAVVQLKDQDWKRVRTILIPTFSTSKLKAIVPFVKGAGDDLIKTLSTAEEEGRVIDIWRTCGVFTMKVILATAFGIDFESKEQEKKLTESAGVLFRDISGILQFLVIYFTPMFALLEPLLGGKIISSVKYLVTTTENVLKERRRNLKDGIPCRRDILQQMIEAGDNDKLTDEEIIAQAIIFLIAGYDTTA
ncbi:Cytochrome P450 3A24, partial [Trichoplax sp. H2]